MTTKGSYLLKSHTIYTLLTQNLKQKTNLKISKQTPKQSSKHKWLDKNGAGGGI